MEKGFLKKDLSFFLLLILLSGVLFFFDQKGWLDALRSGIEKPVLALQQEVYSLNLSLSRFSDYFSSRHEQEGEIMRLQGQVRQLAIEHSQLGVCLEENQRMRRLLGAPLPPKWKFLPAKVVGLTDKMRLDKGQKEGVRTGMMVLMENVLIGKVVSVEAKSALSQTLFDPAVKIPVVIKKPLGGGAEIVGAESGIQARGLYEIELGKKPIVREILQEEDVQGGDLVLTSGEAGYLPDLLIGLVKEVRGREAEIYKTAVIDLLLDYQSLETVFVVTDW